MITSAMRLSNPWLTRARRSGQSRDISGDCDLRVEVDRVWIHHHGPRSNYRPALHVQGRIRSLTFTDDEGRPVSNGDNLTGVTFDPSDGEPLADVFYEFTDEQLAVLVGKGYFQPGFTPPTEMTGIDWLIPAQYQGTVIDPERSGDTPIVFLDVLDQGNLVVDAATSGYSLETYFPDHLSRVRGLEPGSEPLYLDQVHVFEDERDDLLAGVDLGQQEGRQGSRNEEDPESEGRDNEAEASSILSILSDEPEVVSLPEVSTPLFDKLVERFQQGGADGDQDEHGSPSLGELDEVYATRVAPVVPSQGQHRSDPDPSSPRRATRAAAIRQQIETVMEDEHLQEGDELDLGLDDNDSMSM